MKTIARYAWIPSILASLAISTYSLFWVARTWGLPPLLAAAVSTVFDGAALTFADLALRYARTHGDSGLAPRLAVLILAGLSAYLNSWHAVLSGDPSAARILYATPPVVSIALFELHTRWERRAALRRAGRVPAALPVFGRWAWMLFPLRTLRVLRSVVAYRLESIENANGAHRESAASDQVATDNSAETRQRSGKPSAVRVWARLHGFDVSDTGRIPSEIHAAYEADNAREHGFRLKEIRVNGHDSSKESLVDSRLRGLGSHDGIHRNWRAALPPETHSARSHLAMDHGTQPRRPASDKRGLAYPR